MNSILRTHLICLTAILPLAALSPCAPARAAAADPHDGIACASCHGRSAARVAPASLDGGGPDPRAATCRACHRDLGRRTARTAGALASHADPTADCTTCHLFHDPGRVKTAVGELRRGNDRMAREASGHCAGCHGDGAALGRLSPAHRTAATLYHRDAGLLATQSPSEACLNCHDAGASSPWLREAGDQALAFNPHASHRFGIEVVAGSGQDERRLREQIDPRLRLFAGRLECVTCHDLTATTDDLLVPFEKPQDLCLGCHQLRNPRPSTERRALMATMMAVE
jgi:predicted CXXCH cytochrome family protein